MIEWEYYTTRDNSSLNELGREGWELVAIVSDTPTGAPLLYFKRPVQSFRDRVTQEQKARFYSRVGREVSPEGVH